MKQKKFCRHFFNRKSKNNFFSTSSMEQLQLLTATSIPSLTNNGVYSFRCAHCSLAFQTDARLREHQLRHSGGFRIAQQCPFTPVCSQPSAIVFESAEQLRKHFEEYHDHEDVSREETTQTCGVCSESLDKGASIETIFEHLNSPQHIKKLKQEQSDSIDKSVAEGGAEFNEQLFHFFMKQNPFFSTPTSTDSVDISNRATASTGFKCNVCQLHYENTQTLDTHLRQPAHQKRMRRLAELVANNELDPSLPVSEQPDGLPQKSIGQLIGAFAAEKSDSQLRIGNGSKVGTFFEA